MSTPVQRQYWELKNQNPDAVLFFRLGDFYELFYEDAVVGSKVLGITLTARHKGTDNQMPMCGFPYHAHEEYLRVLLQSGYKVAIAEQQEDTDGKIYRRIDRIETPGTSVSLGESDQTKNRIVSTFSKYKNGYSCAALDFTTGSFWVFSSEKQSEVIDMIQSFQPQELVCTQDVFEDDSLMDAFPKTHRTVRNDKKKSENESKVLQQFQVPSFDILDIDSSTAEVHCIARLLFYIEDTQRTQTNHICHIQRYDQKHHVALDPITYRHLEIFESLHPDEKNATLYSVFDRASTPMGARMLRQWLAHPLYNEKQIQKRLDCVEVLLKDRPYRDQIAESLHQIPDLERLLSRCVIGRGTPKDFGAFRDAFSVFPNLYTLCKKSDGLFDEYAVLFQGFESLYTLLDSHLTESPPVQMSIGGIFKAGVSKELDEYFDLFMNGKQWCDRYTEEQKKETGITTLRVKYSNNFGYCFEVSKSHIKNVPSSWERRQTLVNAERFTTPELKNYEERVLSAEGEIARIQQQLFESLRDQFLHFVSAIQKVSAGIAFLDGVHTLSRTALQWGWTKPVMDDSGVLHITKGRHPVVEKLSKDPFIANDIVLKPEGIHMITGPNMAGKSTFLRQNALLLILAQMGSFVPAERMVFTPVDRIFTRVGASDNLAGGKSTFFVEMTETARILRNATNKSFVILDEIGRGTSTFDGLSLAWAITHYIHDEIKCKTLFATHYHELIDTANSLKNVQNFHVRVAQDSTGIVFLRRIESGGISDSFGIEVALSAGIPQKVITHAKHILKRLESQSHPPQLQMGLFETQKEQNNKVSPLEEAIRCYDINNKTPKEALDFLFHLKALLSDEI